MHTCTMQAGAPDSETPEPRWFKVYEYELETILQLGTRREVLVALALLRHANSTSRIAFPSCTTIGTSIGVARNHVSAALAKLEKEGAIEFKGLRKCVRSYCVVSRPRDMSHPRDMSQERDATCPADGTQPVPSTGHRTELRTELRTDPPTPQRGVPVELGRASTPSLFPVAPEDDRPELGKTEAKRRPRLSPELREYAERIAHFAIHEVRGRKSANQVSKIRDVMATWADTPVAHSLHEPKLWTEAFRAARSWWNPKRGGVCAALAVEATKMLQAQLEELAANEAREDSKAELEQEATKLRERAELEERARSGDKEAIRELWRQGGAEESHAQ